MSHDRAAASRAIEDFLRALGIRVEGELTETGDRVASAWGDEILRGYRVDIPSLIADGSMVLSTPNPSQLVVVRDMFVSTMCPHHLLPALGEASVMYLPGDRLAGLGTIAAVVDAFAGRLSFQETIGQQVAETLVEQLGARGALCKLSLKHACLAIRGERKTTAVTETLNLAGTFSTAGPDRDLALATL